MRDTIRSVTAAFGSLLALALLPGSASAHGPSQLPPPPGEVITPAALPVDERDRSGPARDLLLVAVGGMSVASGVAAYSLNRRSRTSRTDAPSEGSG